MVNYDETIADELAQWDEDDEIKNGANEKEDTDYAEIEDGYYSAVIEEMVLKRSKSTNRPMVEWSLRIKKPRFINRKLWKYSMLDKKISVKIFKKEMKAIGIDLDEVKKTGEKIEEAVGLKVAIRKVTKDEYENIYINGIVKENDDIENDIEDDSPVTPAPEQDDEIPF